MGEYLQTYKTQANVTEQSFSCRQQENILTRGKKLEKEVSLIETQQLHIEERKVERLGARRLIKIYIQRQKQSNGIENTEELKEEILKQKNK